MNQGSTVSYDSARNQMWFRLLGEEYLQGGATQRKNMRIKYANERGLRPRDIQPGMEYSIVPQELQLGSCPIVSTKAFEYGLAKWKEAQAAYQQEQAPTPNNDMPQTKRYAEALNSWNKRYQEQQEQNIAKGYIQEKNMYAHANINATMTQFDPDATKVAHLLDRLADAYHDKKTLAKSLFKIEDSAFEPKTPKEYVERIKAGAFTFTRPDRVTPEGEWTTAVDYIHSSPSAYISWRTEPADTKGFEAWKDRVLAAKQKVEDTIRVLTPAEGLTALQAFEDATID